MKGSGWKVIDVIAYVLVLIGALNWGLIGFFGFNLVSALFGEMTVLSRVVYALVGLAAIYNIFALPGMLRRWRAPATTEAAAERERVHV
jgi:uncharacterized membrane protein YuzA (DUF378 family)